MSLPSQLMMSHAVLAHPIQGQGMMSMPRAPQLPLPPASPSAKPMDGECKWGCDRDRDRKHEQIMGQAKGSGGVGMLSGAMQKGPSDD